MSDTRNVQASTVVTWHRHLQMDCAAFRANLRCTWAMPQRLDMPTLHSFQIWSPSSISTAVFLNPASELEYHNGLPEDSWSCCKYPSSSQPPTPSEMQAYPVAAL